jgi:hypothetical protein
MFPGGKGIRRSQSNKGDFIHQFIIGFSSKPPYDMCQSGFDTTNGEFGYANNKYNGFALIHATPERLTISMKGVEYDGPTVVKDLYEVVIENKNTGMFI